MTYEQALLAFKQRRNVMNASAFCRQAGIRLAALKGELNPGDYRYRYRMTDEEKSAFAEQMQSHLEE